MLGAAAPLEGSDWSQWRGPYGTGAAPESARPPIRWAESENVAFKVALPGLGHSTPVISGDRIFLTAAVERTPQEPAEASPHIHGAHDNVAPAHLYDYVVMAIDRLAGSTLWQRTVHSEVPHESTHKSGSWASGSPVTDGSVVVATFGSRGVFGLTVEGELLWKSDLGDMRIKHGHGEGTSLALARGTVVLNWDHEGESFVVALDARSGTERWRAKRSEGTSWSSPLVVKHEDRYQVIVAATERVRAYDLESGELVWECGGLTGNVVASPVAGGGFVFVANSYETREMMAIRLAGAKGDVTGTDMVVWSRHRDTPYVPSPVLYRGSLCFLKHYQGILTCVDAGSGGETLAPRRLPGIGNVYSSLVAANGRIYVVGRDGATAVLDHGKAFEVLAVNSLEDRFSASPMIVDDSLYLRGERWLYRIAAGGEPRSLTPQGKNSSATALEKP